MARHKAQCLTRLRVDFRITEEVKKTPAGAARVARLTQQADRYLAEEIEKGDQASAQGGMDENVPKTEPPPLAFVPFPQASIPAVVPFAEDPIAAADPRPRPRPQDHNEEQSQEPRDIDTPADEPPAPPIESTMDVDML